MAEVEVRDIRKAFGGVPAVDGVNLVCHDGEYLVLTVKHTASLSGDFRSGGFRG